MIDTTPPASEPGGTMASDDRNVLMVRFVLFETASNQRFIFDTNKLREAVGASEMVYRATTELVVQAVAADAARSSDEVWSDGRPPDDDNGIWPAATDDSDAGNSNQRIAIADPHEFRRRLLCDERNFRYQQNYDSLVAGLRKLTDKPLVEVVVAASGKAILLVAGDDPADPDTGDAVTAAADAKDGSSLKRAYRIVRCATTRALRELPGITLTGAIGDRFDLLASDPESLDRELARVRRRLAAMGASVPGSQSRFGRLPPVRPCQTSGLPAAVRRFFRPDADGRQDPPLVLSAQSAVKGGYFGMIKNGRYTGREDGFPQQGLERITRLVGSKAGARLFQHLRDLELVLGQPGLQPASDREAAPPPIEARSLSWLSVIHADGNGLGQIFLNFSRALPPAKASEDGTIPPPWRHYLDTLRKFSAGLDVCTSKAFAAAILKAFNRLDTESERHRLAVSAQRADAPTCYKLPMAPLILGGDDLTLLCDGEMALQLTADFLSAFHAETAADHAEEGVGTVVRDVAQQALGSGGLSAAAGCAIVKAHYPFHAAYDITEDLLASAKQVKRWSRADNGAGSGPPRMAQCSALDFHLLYDSSGRSLAAIRDRLVQADGRTHLYARPYLIPAPAAETVKPAVGKGADRRMSSREVKAAGIPQQLDCQLQVRHWNFLRSGLVRCGTGKALGDQSGDPDAALSARSLHVLRAALHTSPAVGDAILANQLGRGGRDDLAAARLIWVPDGHDDAAAPSLYFAIGPPPAAPDRDAGASDDDRERVARLLDIMEALEVWIPDDGPATAGDPS